MKDQTKIIVALLAGAAVGAAVSLLLAPSSGSELREDIADYVDDVINSVRNKADEAVANIRKYGNSTLERSKSKLRNAGKDLSNYKDDINSKASHLANSGREVVNNLKSKIRNSANDLNDAVQDS